MPDKKDDSNKPKEKSIGDKIIDIIHSVTSSNKDDMSETIFARKKKADDAALEATERGEDGNEVRKKVMYPKGKGD